MAAANRSRPGTRVLLWAGCALVVLPAALPGSGLDRPSAVVAASGAAWAAAWILQSARVGRPVDGGGWVAWLLAAAAVTLAQAIPVGPGLARALGGAAAARIDAVLAVVGTGRASWALSAEPARTLGEAARLGAWALVLLAFTGLASRRDRARVLLRTVGILGLAEAAIGGAHLVLGVDSLFGLYQGQATAAGGFLTTLLNRNHAAGLLGLAAFSWAALALDEDRPRRRGAAWAAALACGLAVVLTFSRGGIAVLLLGAAVLAIRAWAPWRAEAAGSRGLRALVAVGGLAVAGVAVLALDLLLRHVAKTFFGADAWAGKTQAWGPTLDLVADQPWAGVGRGAFPTVFTTYNDFRPDLVFRFVEDLPLQALADWGLPAGLGLLGAGLALAAGTLAASAAEPAVLAAAVGLAGLLLQNLVDFSLEMPGVAVPALAVLGVVAGRVRAEARGRGWGAARKGLALALAVAVLPAAWWAATRGPEADGARLRALAGEADAGRLPKVEDVEATLVAVASRHPLDAQSLFQGARLLRALDRDERALALARQARLLAPGSLEIGRETLALEWKTRHLAEAAGTVRRLLEQHPGRRADLLDDVARSGVGVGDLLGAFGGMDGTLWALADHLALKGRDDAERRLLSVALAAAPEDERLLDRLGRVLVRAGALDEAERLATRLLAGHPDRPAGWFLQGRLAAARGRPLEALEMFREARRLDPAAPEAAVDELYALQALGRWEEFDQALRRVPVGVARDPSLGAHLHLLQASRLEFLGDPARALGEVEAAERAAPASPDILLRKAALLRALKRNPEAAMAYRQVLKLRPGNEVATRGLAEVEDAASRGP